jgi:hypothetical protein
MRAALATNQHENAMDEQGGAGEDSRQDAKIAKGGNSNSGILSFRNSEHKNFEICIPPLAILASCMVRAALE